MSFFGKFKAGAGASGANGTSTSTKKDPNAPPPTKLEKHLKDINTPIRIDGSDKFFGFENYGSTCYSNSIIQCLYYSAPFREHVINFPPKDFVQNVTSTDSNGAPLSPRSTSAIPWPNPTSPARKQPPAPGSPAAAGKPEETKDSPDYLKRMALQSGPVLDMVHDNSNRYGMEESLFTALKDIFDAIKSNSSRKGVVSPHKFLEILRRENEMFRSAMHQDAHEFLNLLLNEVVENVEAFSKLHPAQNGELTSGAPTEKALPRSVSTSTTNTEPNANGIDTRWVHDLFEGLLTSETRCLTCENLSQRDEPFLDLSVDLAAHTSVTSCLRKFSEEEMLCERNKFHCDNCGGLQEAEKRMKIKRLPRVLALHLKRFKYTEDLQRLQKLFHRVVYPFHLRLFNTTDDAEDPDRLYELYAVVVHIGGGPYHGHYVSIIKTQDRGWLLFDDELVEPVDESYVLNFFGGEPVPGLQDAKQLACAYLLFYQETTLDSVLREQELEGREPAESSQVSDVVEPLKDPMLPPKPALNTREPVSPTPLEESNSMDSLARATTYQPVASPAEVPLVPTQTIPTEPLTHSKSKKERREEEKERKAAAKAAEKERMEKQNEASKRRIEAWKKQDEELKAAMEASKQTATDESQLRGEKEGGLARFKPGGISLRSKPKLFGSREKEGSTDRLPAIPQAPVESTTTVTPTESTPSLSMNTTAPVVAAIPEVTSPLFEEKAKRHRFSLGKKKL